MTIQRIIWPVSIGGNDLEAGLETLHTSAIIYSLPRTVDPTLFWNLRG